MRGCSTYLRIEAPMQHISGLSIQNIAHLAAASISAVQVGSGIPSMPENLHHHFEASPALSRAQAILQRSWHNFKIWHYGLSVQNTARSQNLHRCDQGTRATSPEYCSVRLHHCEALPCCRTGTSVPRSVRIYTLPTGANVRSRRRLLSGSPDILPGQSRQRKLRHGRKRKVVRWFRKQKWGGRV